MKNFTLFSVFVRFFQKKIVMHSVIFISLVMFTLPSWAMVLDWNGSYELELNFLQEGSFESFGKANTFHSLHLKPDIKVFDGVRVKSWFYLKPTFSSQSESEVRPKFQQQEGEVFGFTQEGDFSPPLIGVRDLYLQIAHDFGLFEIGRKPHHFGLGMYYNDSSEPFSPVYNIEGMTGFISWRGFIGSSYYIQPLIHYLSSSQFNLFLQVGWTKEQYGIEAIYKTAPQGIEPEVPIESPSYVGAYGYYKLNESLSAQLEIGGQLTEEVYGGFLEIDWQSPIKWLDAGLNLGASTTKENKVFYFDPSFSSKLSFLLEQYEFKQDELTSGSEYLKTYLRYSFNSSFYISPTLSFALSDSFNIQTQFAAHFSYPDFSFTLYHMECMLNYQLTEGLTWTTSIGTLFPSEDKWQIGVLSQVAITF